MTTSTAQHSTPKSDQVQPDIPPSRFILDLDQPLQLQALLEALDLLRYPPPVLENNPFLAQWRARVWVRLSYLLLHCSITRSGDSQADLYTLGQVHNSLAQALLNRDRLLNRSLELPRE